MDRFDFNYIDIGFWDVLDVLIVGYLIYIIYRLLKGTIASRIFIGVVLMFLFWWLVKYLDMRLLSTVLEKFVSFFVVIMVIIFQPEVRRFLLMLGNNTLKGRGKVFSTLFGKLTHNLHVEQEPEWIEELVDSLLYLSRKRYGALIVIAHNIDSSYWENSGTELEAGITSPLIRNIFYKGAPLHDGAVIISKNKILAASVILPVTQSNKISCDLGLRHRAALGMSETADALCIVVSEETGNISYAHEGVMVLDVNESKIKKVITDYVLRKE